MSATFVGKIDRKMGFPKRSMQSITRQMKKLNKNAGYAQFDEKYIRKK